MMTVVMPQMIGMFTTMGVDLPLATRILMGATEFFGDNWLYIIIFLAVLGALFMWMLKQPRGRRVLDKVRLTIPLIGPPTLLGELSRFARTMAMLVTAGLSLQEIMELIPQSSNNLFIREALNQVNEGLILGEGLSEPMSRIELFPPLLIQMVAVGEESNSLDFSMGVVADFYEVSAEEKTSAMISMLTPISTIAIALFVGFIAIAVLMPMYTLTSVF
jgi:type IV pilus assembly protein PilC